MVKLLLLAGVVYVVYSLVEGAPPIEMYCDKIESVDSKTTHLGQMKFFR